MTPALTIATHRQNVDIDLGVIESEDGLVTDYVEKPTMRFDVSMGVYVYDPDVLPLIPDRHFDFPDVVKAMLDSNRKVATSTRAPESGSTSGRSANTSGPSPRSRPTRNCSRMPEWRVPLADVEVSEEEIAAVAETYRSGWLSMGPRTEELEERFAEYVGAGHAVAVTNGTAALHLICAAAGLGPGDEVIVPSLTFVATAGAIRQAGATPVFADIAGLDRPWLAADAAMAATGERTKAIMNMTYGGHPGESSALRDLAAERGLLLLEDAAHGLGGSEGGRQLGTFGLMGAYSFFSNKNLPIGEGGMLVTDDDELVARARLLRSHGMTTLTWDRHRGHASGYDVVEPGFNYRIDEPRATLAIARLARLDADNARRAAAAALYRERLDGLDGITPTARRPRGEPVGEPPLHRGPGRRRRP